MGRELNLFGLLDQAADRFGDRGAVFLGERQLHTWGALRDRALRIASTLGAPGTRIAIASENRPEIVELMFATWAAECVVVPINFKLHPREMVQILDDAGVAQVFASPKIGAQLTSITDVPVETVDSQPYSARLTRHPCRSSARHRPSDAGVAVLHQRYDRTIERCDAHAPQSHGDDGVAPRRLRRTRSGLQPDPRGADVARLGPVHPAVRVTRRAAGDSRVRRVRTGRVPRPLRSPSGLQRVPRAHDGAATRPDSDVHARRICGRSCTAEARCTSTA